MPVIDLEKVKLARKLAEEFNRQFARELADARRKGVKIQYRLETEEQIGRGKIYVAEVRVIPIADSVKRAFKRHGAVMIQARADYVEPPDAFDAIKAALKEAWTLGMDAGVL